MKSASKSISVWITCFAALLSVLGAADIALAAPGVSYRIETGNFDTGIVLAMPSHRADGSPFAHHFTPLLPETSAESELDESDHEDLFSPPGRDFVSRAYLARLMRAHLLRRVATTSGSPDSRGPPHA